MTLNVINLLTLCGISNTILKTGSDELLLRKRISKRSFRETAAGIWVNNKSEAKRPYGQALGIIMDLGLGMVGAIGQVYILTKTGKNNLLTKGAFFGVTFGAVITGMLSGFNSNKVKPKDARSNLSYIVSDIFFGLGSIYTASMLGDESLWDTPPANDYLQPTRSTTAEKKQTISMAK